MSLLNATPARSNSARLDRPGHFSARHSAVRSDWRIMRAVS